MKYVYLDQKCWIRLLRQREGLEEDERLQNALEFIQDSDEGYIFPLSAQHLIETSSTHEDRRKDLMEFMLDISEGHSIAPYLAIRKREIEEMVKHQIGRETSDLQDKALGRGIAYTAGGDNYQIKSTTGNHDEDFIEDAYDAVESKWAFEKVINDQEIVEELGDRSMEKELAQDIEKIRKQQEKEFDSKEMRRKITMAQHMIKEITPYMSKYGIELGVEKEEILDLNSTKEEILEIFQMVRSEYTRCLLTYNRDIDTQREIDSNDFNDICFLSMAIPYCDIVVTEGMWAHIASQENLDDLYGTEMFSSVEDFVEYVKES
jgi:hypothetical protein